MIAGACILAVDWSGALRGVRRKIWLAEANGGLCRLEAGRNRAELAGHLIALATRTPDLIVGLDFAFSLPAWFLKERRFESARDLWAACREEGEAWLRACRPPFWGRPGCRRPPMADADGFRQTDRSVPSTGIIRPKSPFQIGGAGAVGTGSIRGMAVLHTLAEAGFSVWPFDAPRLPMLVEIYPRLLTGSVNKSNQSDREAFLDGHHRDLHGDLRTVAASSEDAFDAAISAMVMARHRNEMLALPEASDAIEQLEGRIWYPGHLGT